MTPSPRVALVTGAARGIGRATAVALARQGCAVLVHDRDAEGATTTADLVRAAGGQAEVAVADLAEPHQAAALVTVAEETLGPVDVLVNNAGLTRDALLHKLTDDAWDEVLAVDLSAPFRLGQAAARGMIARRRGRIVNVASLAWLGNVGQSNYAAAKAGLVGLTRTWALELGRHGITANVVAPGFIDTPMTAAVPAHVHAAFVRKVPLGRIGRPEDVAEVIAFLASDAAAYVSGQVLQVDGGLSVGIGGLFDAGRP